MQEVFVKDYSKNLGLDISGDLSFGLAFVVPPFHRKNKFFTITFQMYNSNPLESP